MVAQTSPDAPVVDDATFMENVREAIENGYDVACVWCGTGVVDGFEIHERACPEFNDSNPATRP